MSCVFVRGGVWGGGGGDGDAENETKKMVATNNTRLDIKTTCGSEHMTLRTNQNTNIWSIRDKGGNIHTSQASEHAGV